MPGSENIKRQRLIDFLLDPSSYPHSPPRVTHLQTHISDIFIAPPYVYKVKKPVNLGFLDFSTLERRKHYCSAEVELNGRLCSGVYLGVEEITVSDGKHSFGGQGAVVEYAVRMRQLPESGFLLNMLGEGGAGEDDLRRIARKLVDFYTSQPRRAEVTEYGLPERVRVNIDENLSISRKFTGKTITRTAYDALLYYNERFFSDNRGLFLKRMEEGFIRDCHGDLHLGNICMSGGGICIYDCIEFNERFRYIDTASDIAFLAMDLDYNGYHGLSRFIVGEVSRTMDDPGMYDVMDFYKCYRAFVRGKVESIKAFEPEVPENERNESLDKASRYFRNALRYALFGSNPAVIVTFGIIGTGKSTLAGMLGQELSCVTVSSDAVRKEITGTPLKKREYERWEGGIYTSEITDRTYREIVSRALAGAAKDGVAVLDASFSKRVWRDYLLRQSKLAGTEVYFVRTSLPLEEVELRLINRDKEALSISDAGTVLLPRFLAEWEEPDDIKGDRYFKASTERPAQEVLGTLLKKIIDAAAS